MAPGKTCIAFNVGGTGHVNPMLPVIKALADKGWVVEFYGYSAGDPSIVDKVQRAGARWHHVGGQGYECFEATHHNPGKWAPLAVQPAAVALLPSLLEAVRATTPRPSLILYDTFAVWGSYIAQLEKIPSMASHASKFFSKASVQDLLAGPEPALHANAINDAAVRTLREVYGIETSVEECISSNSPDLNVAYTVEQFAPLTLLPGEQVPNPVFAGTSVAPRPLSDADEAYVARCKDVAARSSRPGGAPARFVLYSMGTVVTNSRESDAMVFEALGGLEQQGVYVMMATGRRDRATGASEAAAAPPPPTPPANFLVATPFVPQLACLELASCFVTHGGMNSVQESLAFSTPMVVIPHFGDQPGNADRVVELGCGVRLSRQGLTAAALRAAVLEVIDSRECAAAAAAMSVAMRSGCGVAGVVAAIEALPGCSGDTA